MNRLQPPAALLPQRRLFAVQGLFGGLFFRLFICLAAVPASTAVADHGATVVTLIDDLPAAGRLAAPTTGQTLYIIDDERRAIMAIDPFEPAKRWTVIGPETLDGDAGAAATRPIAIGCIDSNTLALVCRTGDTWSVRIYNKLAPPGSKTESASLLQTLRLGASPQEAPGVDLIVSPSREWLAVIGLPPPLPPVVRAPIAGARAEPLTERRCPRLPAAGRPVAATISSGEEWVLFAPDPAREPFRAFLTFYSNAGTQRLLHLDSGLTRVADAACCRGSGRLWAVGSGAPPDQLAGLWRIDAVLEHGQQAARPTCVAQLESPLSLACLSDRAIAVTVGGTQRRVVLVHPLAASPDDSAPTP